MMSSRILLVPQASDCIINIWVGREEQMWLFYIWQGILYERGVLGPRLGVPGIWRLFLHACIYCTLLLQQPMHTKMYSRQQQKPSGA